MMKTNIKKRVGITILILTLTLPFLYSASAPSGNPSLISLNLGGIIGTKGIGVSNTINMYYFFNDYNSEVKKESSNFRFSLGLWAEIGMGNFSGFYKNEEILEEDGTTRTSPIYGSYFYIGPIIGLGMVEELGNKFKLYQGIGCGLYIDTSSYNSNNGYTGYGSSGYSINFDFVASYFFTKHFGLDIGAQLDLHFGEIFNFLCNFNPYVGLAFKL